MASAGALLVPATLALLRLHVPQERRGRVIGLFGAAQGMAATLGPVMGRKIVALFGWRAVFLANVHFVAVAAILLLLFPIPAGPKQQRTALGDLLLPLDVPGIGFLALSLSCLIPAATSLGPPKFVPWSKRPSQALASTTMGIPLKLVGFTGKVFSARYLRRFRIKNGRYSDAQITAVLKQAEGGVPVSELCREHELSSASFYKWRAKFGGMDASLISEMKDMAKESRHLQRRYAEMSMQSVRDQRDLLQMQLNPER